MFALIIVIHYHMVCLTTVSKDYQKLMNSAVHNFCKLAKFLHISDVLMDFHCLPVCQRSLNFILLDIL